MYWTFGIQVSFSDLFGRIYIIVEVRGCGTCCTARRNCTFYLSEVDEINFKVSEDGVRGRYIVMSPLPSGGGGHEGSVEDELS